MIKLNHCVLSPLPDLPNIFVIVVKTCVCRRSVDNKAVILSYPSGGGVVLGLMFAGYVPLASHSPYPIVVYFWANYRPHLSHVLENVIFAIST